VRRPCTDRLQLLGSTIEAAEAPAPGYAIVKARPEVRLEADPGQFAMLRVPPTCGAMLCRPMSILDAGRTVDFLIRDVGSGSRALARLKPGDELEMIAPLGTGFDPPGGGSEVLCGGGVGASPLLFYAREAAARGHRVTMLYGGRTRDDLVLAGRMDDVCDLILVTEDGSAGLRGLATQPLAGLLERGGVDRVLACGPVAMMASAARLALEAGVTCHVCLEAMMACGFGACLGCAVPASPGGYIYACTDGPVVDAALVDWSLLAGAKASATG
jgi:dihydroorotate dehydrogenase electron transfer subunit